MRHAVAMLTAYKDCVGTIQKWLEAAPIGYKHTLSRRWIEFRNKLKTGRGGKAPYTHECRIVQITNLETGKLICEK